MFTIEQFTTLLGWCLIINLSILLISSLLIVLLKTQIAALHNKLTGIELDSLNVLYFQYLGNYKIAILVLNLAPYLALKMMV